MHHKFGSANISEQVKLTGDYSPIKQTLPMIDEAEEDYSFEDSTAGLILSKDIKKKGVTPDVPNDRQSRRAKSRKSIIGVDLQQGSTKKPQKKILRISSQGFYSKDSPKKKEKKNESITKTTYKVKRRTSMLLETIAQNESEQ